MRSSRRFFNAKKNLSTYDAAIVADSPAAYITLEGGSAGVSDRSGNGNNGTLVNAPSVTTFPTGEGATVFNGSTQYVEIADTPTLSPVTVLLKDTFSVADGLITNEFAYFNPGVGGIKTSANFDMNSGSLYAQGGTAWSGVPDDTVPNISSNNGTDSAIFRMITKGSSYGDVTVSMKLRNNSLTSTTSTPAVDWDGIHIWLRYQDETLLYYTSVNRRDGTCVIKKKRPPGTDNGGTYYELTSYIPHTVPYGSWQNVSASARNNPDGSVTITLSADGVLLAAAVDDGSIGGAPITAAGKVGIRGDNCNFNFDDFTVTGPGPITVEAWVRPDVTLFPHTEGSGYVYFLGKNTGGLSEYSCRMYSSDNTEARANRISGYSFNLAGGLGAGSYFQDTVTAGQWIHYVLVINPTATSTQYPTGYTKLYKNGVLRDQDALSDYNIVPCRGTAPLRIASPTLSSYFQGAVAKVAVYNSELTAFKVRDHYQLVVPPVNGSAKFVKSVGTASRITAGTTLSITVPDIGVSPGSTLVARVAHDYTVGGPTMADSKGNTWTRQLTGANAGTTLRASIFTCPVNNQLLGGDTILLTTSASTATCVLSVAEFSNVTFATPLDVTNSTSNAGSTTPGTTIPITTTNADDLLLGHVAVLGPSTETYTEDTLNQWTTGARIGTTGGTPNVTSNGAYRAVGTTGSYSYTPTLGTSETWVEQIISLKGGVPTISPTPPGVASYIQTVGSASNTTSGTTLTVTVPFGGVPAGHTLLVRLAHAYTTGGPTCADSRGNTYTRDRTAADGGTTIRHSVFSCRVATALLAGDTITVTLSAAVTAKAVAVDEFASVLSPVTIDVQNGLASSGTAPSIPNTTVHASDLLYATVATLGPTGDTYSEDTFHQWRQMTRAGTASGGTDVTMNGAYRSVGATGTYTYAPTLGTSRTYVTFMIAYEGT